MSAADAHARLARAGALCIVPREFEDNLLFDDAQGGLRATGGILRLRRTPRGGVVTFKGRRRIADGLRTRDEVETEVKDADAAQSLLGRLGFAAVFRYQKYRETWSLLEQAVVVDETPIGTFLEIEGEAEGIHRAAAALGFTRADYLTDSYAGLFAAGGGKGDMVFPR